MDHGKNCDHTNCTHANTSVSQTLSEMHWERGLWYAGNFLMLFATLDNLLLYQA